MGWRTFYVSGNIRGDVPSENGIVTRDVRVHKFPVVNLTPGRAIEHTFVHFVDRYGMQGAKWIAPPTVNGEAYEG